MRSNKIKLVQLLRLTEAEEKADKGAEGKEEQPTKKAARPAEEPNVKFDISAVKRYNDTKFLGDEGVILSADKDGLKVKVLPDQVMVLVNFRDVL